MFISEIREWLTTRHVGQAFQPAMYWAELRQLRRADISLTVQYKRRLPHRELPGSTYFITFRVDRRIGPALESVPLASIVEESVWFGHSERYLIDAYVIMPDHVHLLVKPIGEWTVSRILQGIKGFTAREINMRLNKRGPFWQDERFDHLVRNDPDWLERFDYIYDNPVRAGLVQKPQDYPFSSLVTMHSNGRLESLPHRPGLASVQGG